MSKTTRMLAWLLPAAALFSVGFALAARFDLPLAHLLYHPASAFAIVMEAVGWYPAFVPTLLLMLLTASSGLRGAQKRPVIVAAGLALSLGLCAVLYRQSWRYFAGRGVAQTPAEPLFWLLAALGLALYAACCLLAFRVGTPVWRRLRFWGLAGSAWLLAETVVVNGVKLLWQRPRFDTMLAGVALDQYSPWYRFGVGGSSFPSAHTANACGIFLLLLLCDLFPRWARHRRLLTALCWLYVAAMALARIMMGRHFLSDTLAGALLGALLFWALRSCPPYRRGLDELLKTTPLGKR